jgi:hypothetical protein
MHALEEMRYCVVLEKTLLVRSLERFPHQGVRKDAPM